MDIYIYMYILCTLIYSRTLSILIVPKHMFGEKGIPPQPHLSDITRSFEIPARINTPCITFQKKIKYIYIYTYIYIHLFSEPESVLMTKDAPPYNVLLN